MDLVFLFKQEDQTILLLFPQPMPPPHPQVQQRQQQQQRRGRPPSCWPKCPKSSSTHCITSNTGGNLYNPGTQHPKTRPQTPPKSLHMQQLRPRWQRWWQWIRLWSILWRNSQAFMVTGRKHGTVIVKVMLYHCRRPMSWPGRGRRNLGTWGLDLLPVVEAFWTLHASGVRRLRTAAGTGHGFRVSLHQR